MLNGIESADLKLIRAAEHIESVRSAVWDYLANEPSGVARHSDGKHKMQFATPPPPEIAIFAGVALYQMRSALDHLAFDLAQMNSTNVQLPAKWEKRCEFRLLIDVPTKGNTKVPRNLPLPYNFFEETLPGISRGAFAIIEGLQPYYGGDGPAQLRTLAVLSNIDKHRHLHIPKPEAHVRFDAVIDGLSSTTIIRAEHGADVKSPYPKGVKVAGGLMPFVTFDESALGKHPTRLPAQDLLEFCLEGIKRFVIPAFEKLIKNP